LAINKSFIDILSHFVQLIEYQSSYLILNSNYHHQCISYLYLKLVVAVHGYYQLFDSFFELFDHIIYHLIFNILIEFIILIFLISMLGIIFYVTKFILLGNLGIDVDVLFVGH
jgi:hypothetical protein